MQENKIRISEIFNSRLDPHFYKKEFLELRNSLNNSKTYKLGEVVEFSSETWDQKSKFKDEFPYIEISEIDIITGTIQNINWCPLAKAPSRAKMVVHSGDIIISTTRPNRGAISVIPSKYDGYIASTGFSIIRNIKTNNLNKEYLYEYLRTNISLRQMLRHSSGGNYPAITQEELKKILIYVPDMSAQRKIVKLLSDARIGLQNKLNKAENLITSIRDTLLYELCIKIPDMNSKKVYKTSVENLFSTRIDPKYHQPKYENLEKNIKSNNKKIYSIESLDNICKEVISGQRPKGGVSQILEGIPSIGGEHVFKDGTIAVENLKYIPEDFHQKQLKSKIKPLDIILVKDGATTGKVGIIPEDYPYNEANINEHVFILRCKDNIDPYYLLTFLMSDIGQIQIEREISGATIMGITKDSLKNILIPIPSVSIQNSISNEYKKCLELAKQLKSEANSEYEKAKQRVEDIILGKESL